MQKLSEQLLAKCRQLVYIDPKPIDNDPLYRQILACGRGLAAMAGDNRFHEEPACSEVE